MRNGSQVLEPGAELCANIALRMPHGGDDSVPLGVLTEGAHHDPRLAKIRRHAHAANRREAHPRILHVTHHQRTDLLAELLGDSLAARRPGGMPKRLG